MGTGNDSAESVLRQENERLRQKNAALEHEATALKGERDELLERVERALHDNESLVEELERLRRRHFGRSSEKVDPSQLILFAREQDEKEPAAAPEPEPDDGSAPEPPRRAKPKRRKKDEPRLPEDLPTERVVHDLAEEDKICPCCGEKLIRIGVDTTETLEYRPASFLRIQHEQLKYACKGCEQTVKRAPPPVRPLAKALPAATLLAWILVSKYKDHLPLHRISRIFARERVKISRSTQCDWVMGAADALRPIVQLMTAEVLAADYVQTDDTHVKVYIPFGKNQEKRKLAQGYLWPYRARNQVVYDFTLSRARDGPERFLEGFSGHLQTDEYAGYHRLRGTPGIIGLGCWAHARRRFVDALPTDVRRVTPVIACLRILYEIERNAKDCPAVLEAGDSEAAYQALVAERLRLRRLRSRRVLADLLRKVRQLEADPAVAPGTLLGKAVTYTLRNRKYLLRFLQHGHLDVDNNAVEQCVRPLALGRKNWLFAGSPRGGHAAATIYSIVETCRLQGIEVLTYLTDVLQRLPTVHPSEVASLTPRNWKRAQDRQLGAGPLAID